MQIIFYKKYFYSKTEGHIFRKQNISILPWQLSRNLPACLHYPDGKDGQKNNVLLWVRPIKLPGYFQFQTWQNLRLGELEIQYPKH